MGMVRRLTTTGSGSLLRIDVRAIQANLSWIRQRAQGRPVMAVVKANAYGTGAAMMARILASHVESFAVATTDEGRELRQAGVEHPILILGPPREATAGDYLKDGLTASVSSPQQAQRLPEGVCWQLVLDSGMRRYGVAPDQIERIREIREAASHLTYTGCYSHHAVADEPENDRVHLQIERFEELARFVRDAGLAGPRHMSNSAALLHEGSLPHYDYLRLGLAIYGLAPGAPRPEPLRPALTWESSLELVRPVRKGEPVSYGGVWTADRDGWLGTMPVGYADGLPRSLSGRLEVAIAGKRYPQVGRVTMDTTMIFLGDDPLSEGSRVTLFGHPGWSLYEWSDAAGSIPHESLTRLSDRVKRVYLF